RCAMARVSRGTRRPAQMRIDRGARLAPYHRSARRGESTAWRRKDVRVRRARARRGVLGLAHHGDHENEDEAVAAQDRETAQSGYEILSPPGGEEDATA